MGRRRGFTILELLVVVAVIALLAAILIPSLSKARQRARTVACVSNLKEMEASLELYATQYHKIFPFGLLAQSWEQLLVNGGSGATNDVGGFGALNKVRACPEAPTMLNPNQSLSFGTAHYQWGNSTETSSNNTGYFSCSYGFNGWLYAGDLANQLGFDGKNIVTSAQFGGYANQRGTASVSNFVTVVSARASTTPAFADANWRHIFAKPSDPAPASVAAEDDPGPDGDVENHPIARVMLNRHDKAVNVSFRDGHAETVKLRQLYGLDWQANWTAPNPLPNVP